MISAKAMLGKCPPKVSQEDFEDVAHAYLASMLRNWQLLHDYDLSWNEGDLYCYTTLSRRDSPDVKYLSSWGREDLKKLVGMSGVAPRWEILDDTEPEELARWSPQTSFVLFTNFLDKHSPIFCLTERKPVAVYMLPINDEIKEDLFSWTTEYRDCDSLYMGSGSLQESAYKQISQVYTPLTAKGRDLADEIEEATNIPTYYFLLNIQEKGEHASAEESSAPKCPGCGKEKPDGIISDPTYPVTIKCSDCMIISGGSLVFSSS